MQTGNVTDLLRSSSRRCAARRAAWSSSAACLPSAALPAFFEFSRCFLVGAAPRPGTVRDGAGFDAAKEDVDELEILIDEEMGSVT